MGDAKSSAALEGPRALTARARSTLIRRIKRYFGDVLCDSLGLEPVEAPLVVSSSSGLNDNLNGVEEPVHFCPPAFDATPTRIEIVQSLAKWKRYALSQYGFSSGEGLVTDMRALRPDEQPDDLHSIFVDQWDWERVVLPEERTRETLQAAVRDIYQAIVKTERFVASQCEWIVPQLPAEITFVTTEEALRRYPSLTPQERESRLCEEYGAVFLIGIGGTLSDGSIHDGRSPDYDDWLHSLNGDILVWHSALRCSFELSSMGIRVDKDALRQQLRIRGATERESLPFHQALLAGQLVESMGGGIGQSRLCMFLLQCTHIGAVQSSVWPEAVRKSHRGLFLP